MEKSGQIPDPVKLHLRKLAHDLSNALETILQASYLLIQTDLDSSSKKWAKMIDAASQEAARVNREIREVLKSQT
jgi:K+-sensing histidine kinase KdpD